MVHYLLCQKTEYNLLFRGLKLKGIKTTEINSFSGSTLKNRILGWMNHGKVLLYMLREG